MTEATVRPDVRRFFERYGQASDGLNLQAVGASFADVFLSLDPNSVSVVTREQLLVVLPRRQQLLAAISGIGANLTDFDEKVLDERHTLARTSWQVRFDAEHEDGEPLALHSSFLLRLEEDGWRIVLYLNHQDIAALVAARFESAAYAT